MQGVARRVKDKNHILTSCFIEQKSFILKTKILIINYLKCINLHRTGTIKNAVNIFFAYCRKE